MTDRPNKKSYGVHFLNLLTDIVVNLDFLFPNSFYSFI